ncbi:VapE domain-containing protein [Dyadobacter sp. 32]|uniref:VapE domain-containing protein n=1 Tax=Dyadobacter sp. 32 TaxID=538966 RepID=UPI0039C65F80
MNSIKVQLLNQVSVSDIVKFYMPGYEPGRVQNYKSPFAEKDDNPSLNFYEKDGTLMFKSHNTGHQGDVFQFVADLKKIDCKNDFNRLIQEIQNDLGLQLPKSVNQSKNIRISFDRQRIELLDYFSKIGVSADILERYKVNQVKFHEFITRKGSHCKFDYKKLKQLAICYSIGDRIKVYFPYIENVQPKKFGFKDQRANDIFGLEQIQSLDYTPDRLFVVAGEKDCLVMTSRNYHSIPFQSENRLPSKEQIKLISGLAKEIFIVYDPDTEGRRFADKLSSATGWKIVNLPNEKEDVTDYFQKNQPQDFEQIVARASVSNVQEETDKPLEIYTIFHQSEDFLSKYYDFRYNTVSLDIEYSKKNAKAFSVVNENQLFVTMNKAGIKVGMDKLICILKSDFVPHFNPVTSYFENLPKWDNEDHIGILASHLHAEQPTQLHVQFKKWLVRCVKCAFEPGYFNKQAFILVHSKQNSGKTTFCRYLCPPALSSYIAENISDDKDSRIALVKNFLINLDELSSLARHEINSLKALFSKDCINERLPYDRKNSIIPRISNFIGSTNMAEFLTDETGSVRWLCFEIHKIDWGYRQAVDINKVWSQAYNLYKSSFQADMNPAEIAENESRNNKFQQRSAEAEIIPTLLRASDSADAFATFMTATDVLQYLQIHSSLRLSKVMIGRAMPICGFIRVKDSKTDRYGYWCVKLNDFSTKPP